jgi:hypothetical protein
LSRPDALKAKATSKELGEGSRHVAGVLGALPNIADFVMT